MSSNESCEMNLCPVNKAMEYVSKKWSIEIIRDMFFGKKRFSEFKEDKPNLSLRKHSFRGVKIQRILTAIKFYLIV